MSSRYPFAAIVGQELLKEALIWLAIDPSIGGLLITGTRGTAKSTAARALADLLPPIVVIPGDAYNRVPEDPTHESAMVATPFVELPVGATEDRVIGTLDVRTLLTKAERRFEPGLLARANRGVLYVDEVNLLPDHLVDVLLDAAATGMNTVERDGASYTHPARVVLIGTMNPEEGELRPQLLDRFGLCVEVTSDDEIERRVRIVRRRMDFERDAAAFALSYRDESAALQARIVLARELLSSVELSGACIEHAAMLAIEARVEGMRADLTIARTARAIAAFEQRSAVSRDDIERAAVPALAHRRRETPRGTPPPAPPKPPEGLPPAPEPLEQERPQPASGSPQAMQGPAIFDMSAAFDPGLDPTIPPARGRGASSRLAARGKSKDPLPTGSARVGTQPTARIAALATVHAAASERGPDMLWSPLDIRDRHLRYIDRRGRERQLVVFLMDASGSMAAARRMSAAKGVVCSLLEDAYHRRDAVALITFSGDDARVVVPPTRSAVLAYRRLRTLPTGGRTPLARGLRCARELMTMHHRRDAGSRAHLVVVSDARANAPEGDAFGLALREAAALKASGLRSLCIDTETGRIRLGNAARLARALEGTYKHLDNCTERALGAAVREWMATA